MLIIDWVMPGLLLWGFMSPLNPGGSGLPTYQAAVWGTSNDVCIVLTPHLTG